ncbi:hypothetical protein JT05_13755 [Desulfosporosinus sp. Tol-M]|nr:hypothetical protein JT05_13755 [Desulfosporosinus sp. Tol-M]
MLRNKSAYILIALAVVVIICILIGTFLSSRDSTLSIQNNTDETISDLKIKYSNSQSIIEVPRISPKQVYETKLILPDNFIEGSIKVFYTDKQGENHEDYLVGYIEKGYKVKINVIIESVDNNGVLTLKIYRT